MNRSEDGEDTMWAEMVVGHAESEAADDVSLLTKVFGLNDPDTLKSSTQFKQESWKNRLLYAKELGSYRILCYRDGNNELVSYIEVKRGTILEACQSAWGKVRTAYAKHNPRLSTLDLVDLQSGAFLSGRISRLGTELKKRESIAPIIVGLATVVYFTVAILTFGANDKIKYTQGAIAGTVAALVALGFAYVEARRGRLRWTERGGK
jgi:hypothetical protein